MTARQRIIEKISREAGPVVLSALADSSVIEILLNPDGHLWIERLGQGLERCGTIDKSTAESLIGTVASSMGVVANASQPILECEFPLDGSRFEAVVAPIVTAPCFSIRKRALRTHDLDDYVAKTIIDASQAILLKKAIAERQNILVVGGTGSGKTTLTNALIHHISETSPEDRLVVLEDTREIQCDGRNTVFLKTSDQVSMTGLLRATLRLRPDRIIVGEVRGGEALALLKAWNTGHPGGIATLHANNAKAGLIRLEQLIGEVSQAPMPRLIAEAVDMICVISKTSTGRKVTEIVAVHGFDGSDYHIIPHDAGV